MESLLLSFDSHSQSFAKQFAQVKLGVWPIILFCSVVGSLAMDTKAKFREGKNCIKFYTRGSMLCKEALFDLFAYFKQSLLNYIDVVSELISDIECESRE